MSRAGPTASPRWKQLKRIAPDLPVVMMSGKANLADAVRGTKLGALFSSSKTADTGGPAPTLRAALQLSRTLAENGGCTSTGHADPLVGGPRRWSSCVR